MAYQKLLGQGQRALVVIPSNTATIPHPGNNKTLDATVAGLYGLPRTSLISDIPGPGVASTLACATGDFINRGIEIGDIVYNYTTRGAGLVTQVNSATELTVDGMLDFSGSGQTFSIFGKEVIPCMIYMNGSTTTTALQVVSAGGDLIDAFNKPNNFNYDSVPFQVRMVTRTTTTSGAANTGITAIW